MKSTTILAVSVVLAVIVVVGAVFFLKGEDKAELPIRVEQYYDFNCPGCRSFHPIWNQLQAEFGDNSDVELFTNNHPILGAASQQAAFAHEAAILQNKGDEYSDILFENFEARTDADFVKFAQELGLDVAKFNTDRESQNLQQGLLDKVNAARERGITSTPTVFVGTRKAVKLDFDSLKEQINSRIELAKSQKNANN